MYIYQRPTWPAFHWADAALAERLGAVRHRQGRLVGRMEALGFALRDEATLGTLTEEVLKSSEIEGEILHEGQVRSSIARRLGLDIGALTPADRKVEGVVELVLDATQKCQEPLTKKRLLGWHAALFPGRRSGMHRIRAGQWRDDGRGPMQVVSGPVGRERVHFEAPPAGRIELEMSRFLAWFNRPPEVDWVLKAAQAHLWFVTIHPFDDGNGRIARALTDMTLARSDGSAQRFYSMSAQIRVERRDYYEILEQTQKASLDVTPWMAWFLGCLDRAFDGAVETLGAVLRKARFWELHRDENFNLRQREILNRLLDGFEGKLTSSKWAKLGRCSQDTAYRDIVELVARGVLLKDDAGGRSTSYSLQG